jgi:hypothetical protein
VRPTQDPLGPDFRVNNDEVVILAHFESAFAFASPQGTDN